MEKVAEQHILTKCSQCNTFQVIRGLLNEFINFNALKINLKIHKKIIEKDPGLGLYSRKVLDLARS